MPLGLLGKKLGHTRVYDANGVMTPVTVVLAGPNRVLQVKTQAGKDGYNAVQLGFDDQKEQRVSKPLLGHFVHDDCKAALADAVSLMNSLGHDLIEAGGRREAAAGLQPLLAALSAGDDDHAAACSRSRRSASAGRRL